MATSLADHKYGLRQQLMLEDLTAAAHAQRVEAIPGHSIRLVERPVNGTCLTHALGMLEGDGFFVVSDLESEDIRPGLDFVKALLRDGYFVEVDSLRPGALVLYFNKDEWTHAGIVSAEGRVVSKWGRYWVFDHVIDEVPATYGDHARFFELPSKGDVIHRFIDFAAAWKVVTPAALYDWLGYPPKRS